MGGLCCRILCSGMYEIYEMLPICTVVVGDCVVKTCFLCYILYIYKEDKLSVRMNIKNFIHVYIYILKDKETQGNRLR